MVLVSQMAKELKLTQAGFADGGIERLRNLGSI